LIGIIASETGTSVTLRESFARETVIPRSSIRKIQSMGQSLMPEGLEGALSLQEMANLLEYISQ